MKQDSFLVNGMATYLQSNAKPNELNQLKAVIYIAQGCMEHGWENVIIL